MPPRGAPARGGVNRGGPARGGAMRGAPGGRGVPPAAPVRGAAATRARPPAAVPPQRMAPTTHTAAASENYGEYVSTAAGEAKVKAGVFLLFFYHYLLLFWTAHLLWKCFPTLEALKCV